MQHEDPCDECGLKFCRIQHEFTCDQCGSKFVSKSKLKYHDRMQHTLPCDECGYDQKCHAGFIPSVLDLKEYIEKHANECAKELNEKAETIGALIREKMTI